MLKKIKLLLYSLKIFKLNTLENKVKYLLLKNIKPYSNNFVGMSGYFIHKNIIEYTEELHKINTSDIFKEYIPVKKISEDRLHKLQYAEWFSLNNRYLSNPDETIKAWLNEVIVFINIYKNISKDMRINIPYSNSIKTKPYIINIEILINDILNA